MIGSNLLCRLPARSEFGIAVSYLTADGGGEGGFLKRTVKRMPTDTRFWEKKSSLWIKDDSLTTVKVLSGVLNLIFRSLI